MTTIETHVRELWPRFGWFLLAVLAVLVAGFGAGLVNGLLSR